MALAIVSQVNNSQRTYSAIIAWAGQKNRKIANAIFHHIYIYHRNGWNVGGSMGPLVHLAPWRFRHWRIAGAGDTLGDYDIPLGCDSRHENRKGRGNKYV